jgi:hypothetical protein
MQDAPDVIQKIGEATGNPNVLDMIKNRAFMDKLQGSVANGSRQALTGGKIARGIASKIPGLDTAADIAEGIGATIGATKDTEGGIIGVGALDLQHQIEKLGKFGLNQQGSMLQNAFMKGGPQGAMMVHNMLMKQDPEYNKVSSQGNTDQVGLSQEPGAAQPSNLPGAVVGLTEEPK